MNRLQFEQFIKENNLEHVNTYRGDFTYTSSSESIGVNMYGIIEQDGKYILRATEYGDRGPFPSHWLDGIYESEEAAFDILKKEVLNNASRTYNKSLEKSIQDFYATIRFKKISKGTKYKDEIDMSFVEFLDLVTQYFPNEFITGVNYGCLQVFSNKFHELIFEIKAHYFYEKDKDGYFIPYMLRILDKHFILSKQLDSTYSECKWEEDGIYILYYNSLTAFDKYDFQGNLLYKTKWSKDCDLRTYRGFMKFTQSSFCINPISYSPRNPKYSDKSFIAITNGIQYGIFDRETGQLIESNYDKSKDIPD